jgi:predicted nuclease of restriction endonuclease-like (RecB) superfamily
MVEVYWQIGRRIVEEELKGAQRATYGEEILQTLSKELTAEFGKGFSYANLKNFKQFYRTFSEEQISYALRSQLTWTHYRLIMRVENPKARQYYVDECIEQTWSTRTLERNINTFYYERLLSSRNKQEALQHSQTLERHNPEDFIKDPYIYEFLNIPEPLNAGEKEIETALINNLQQFLLELGKGFSFVGRQIRISTETTHFYIDLVFYNYILKCFVLFDLKTTKLTHQDIGQMDMYVRMFDDLKRGEDDNPTIGIILCAEKEETIVKYSVLKENQRLFASKYMPYLPTEAELIAEIEREKRMLNEKLKNGGIR